MGDMQQGYIWGICSRGIYEGYAAGVYMGDMQQGVYMGDMQQGYIWGSWSNSSSILA